MTVESDRLRAELRRRVQVKAKRKKQSMAQWCADNGLDYKILYKRDTEETDGMKYMTLLSVCEILQVKPSNVLRKIGK